MVGENADCTILRVEWAKRPKHAVGELNANQLNGFWILYEGISKSFEPNMERARNLDLFCFIFQRSPLPTPHTCPI